MKRIRLKESKIVPVHKRIANDFFSRFEILGNPGLGVWHWGLFFGSNLLSVVSFGTTCFGGKRGWIAQLAQSHGVSLFQLCRGGTWPSAPKGTASRCISLASKAQRIQEGPFISVAYADESLREIGTIYQASNAIYTGLTNPGGQANYQIHRKLHTGWQIRKRYGTRDRMVLREIDPNLNVIPLKPKHRYLLLQVPPSTRRAIVRAIEPFSQPYPNRVANTVS